MSLRRGADWLASDVPAYALACGADILCGYGWCAGDGRALGCFGG